MECMVSSRSNPRMDCRRADREFYVMQGEIYTDMPYGQHGSAEFSVEKLLDEHPEDFAFNGSVGALSKLHPLRAKVGDTVRIFFGVGGPNFTLLFYVIGEIFDKVYMLGGLLSPPLEGIQTVSVAPGGAVITEFKTKVPWDYTLVDHALARAERGLSGILTVEGPPNPEIYNGQVMSGMGHYFGEFELQGPVPGFAEHDCAQHSVEMQEDDRHQNKAPRGGIPRLRPQSVPLLSYGFRPFFLGAALWAGVAMVLWIGLLLGYWTFAGSYGVIAWHAHEFRSGYASAVLTGFPLTAISNWTGRFPLQGRPLLALVALWLAGLSSDAGHRPDRHRRRGGHQLCLFAHAQRRYRARNRSREKLAKFAGGDIGCLGGARQCAVPGRGAGLWRTGLWSPARLRRDHRIDYGGGRKTNAQLYP